MNGLSEDLLRRLKACPPGTPGWTNFEEVCIKILEYLFVPPLKSPHIQARSLHGTDRRDAVFPNRESVVTSSWGMLSRELHARMVLFEFKNFDKEDLGKDAVDQAKNYLNGPMGNLGIICSNKLPSASALQRRNTVYTNDKKVILFLTPVTLEEMCIIKERGEDPADLILDLLEEFYIKHE